MADKKTFKEEVQSYFGRSKVSSKRFPGRQSKPTQEFLASELYMQPETLSRKLNGSQPLTDDDVRDIGSILIYWRCVTRRKQLLHLFDLAGYTLPNNDWLEEPWKSLIDDTQPRQVGYGKFQGERRKEAMHSKLAATRIIKSGSTVGRVKRKNFLLCRIAELVSHSGQRRYRKVDTVKDRRL